MARSASKLAKSRTFKYSDYLIKPGIKPIYTTSLGALFGNDCLEVLPKIKSSSIDTVFADPPFNLGKKYKINTNDNLPEKKYINWCKEWISECCRILKPGGAFFLYNLPKWNIILGHYLYEEGMQFRHWIAIEISACNHKECFRSAKTER
jgi:site-specific DNA-methyltransferase (adenine-specific)